MFRRSWEWIFTISNISEYMQHLSRAWACTLIVRVLPNRIIEANLLRQLIGLVAQKSPSHLVSWVELQGACRTATCLELPVSVHATIINWATLVHSRAVPAYLPSGALRAGVKHVKYAVILELTIQRLTNDQHFRILCHNSDHHSICFIMVDNISLSKYSVVCWVDHTRSEISLVVFVWRSIFHPHLVQSDCPLHPFIYLLCEVPCPWAQPPHVHMTMQFIRERMNMHGV